MYPRELHRAIVGRAADYLHRQTSEKGDLNVVFFVADVVFVERFGGRAPLPHTVVVKFVSDVWNARHYRVLLVRLVYEFYFFVEFVGEVALRQERHDRHVVPSRNERVRKRDLHSFKSANAERGQNKQNFFHFRLRFAAR